MADSIGQAYVQILPTTKGFSSKLSSELSGGGGGAGLLGAGKAMGGKLIAGLAAAGIGAAAVKGISESIKAGGELEQSLGGVDALFGKSADKVKQNAYNSFKTVGMSANDYMQNVTSFSASLLQGLGGDTDKAASIADMAMQDMGDNANRFGTDIESIQNAYQGFAKGNFTMLDNLKLGYGGTKTEMLRLVKDAGVVDKSVTSLDDVSFDQMIEGIHRVQDGLGVTGTTAKEASTTLQGSLASFKAVGQDLLGNLAIGADITPQLSAMLDTAQTFLIDNLLPMVSNVITGVANNAGQIGSLLSTFATNLAQQILTLAPTLLQAGITIITQLGQGLISALPTLLPMIAQVITNLALMLTNPSNLQSLIMTAIQLIQALADGCIKALPVLANALPTIIMNVVNTLIKLAPKLIPVAIKLITTLAKAMIMNVGLLITATFKIGQELIKTFKKTDWKTLGKNVIDGIVKGLKNAGSSLWNTMKSLAKQAINEFKKMFKIGSPSKVMAGLAEWIPIGAALGVKQNAQVFTDAIDDMMYSNPLLSNNGMNMNVSTRDNTSSYSGLLEAVRQGASEARPVVILNNRVLSRELKGMGVSFA